MSVESNGQVNLDKTYKPTFTWSQIDPGAGELTYRSWIPVFDHTVVRWWRTCEKRKLFNILSEANIYRLSKQNTRYSRWRLKISRSFLPLHFRLKCTLWSIFVKYHEATKNIARQKHRGEHFINNDLYTIRSTYLALFFNILREYFLIFLVEGNSLLYMYLGFWNTRFITFKYSTDTFYSLSSLFSFLYFRVGGWLLNKKLKMNLNI